MKIRVEFKPQDLWIGVFWDRRGQGRRAHFHVWICLIPMVPIHIWWKVR